MFECRTNFYKSIFKGTKIGKTSYWGSNPMGVKEGSVLTIHLTVLGQKIMLLNGYPDVFQRIHFVSRAQ